MAASWTPVIRTPKLRSNIRTIQAKSRATNIHICSMRASDLHSRIWKIVLMVDRIAVLVVAAFAIYHEMAAGKLPAFASAAAFLKSHQRDIAMISLILIAAAGIIYIIASYDLIWKTHDAFNNQFEKLRRIYGGFLAWALLGIARSWPWFFRCSCSSRAACSC